MIASLIFPANADEDEFKRLKSLFSGKSLELDDALSSRKMVLLQNYATAIDGVQKTFQEAGHLEGVVSAKAEAEAARAGNLAVVKDPDAVPAEIGRLREVAGKEILKLQTERATALRDLRGRFITALETLKTSSTKAGAVETAVAIAAEIEHQTSLLNGQGTAVRQSLADLSPNLQKGLILWYSFDEETAGNVADLSPTGMAGVPRGTQFAKDGKIGGARSFNGVDDRIELAGQLPDTERFSISVWVKTPGILGKGGIFSDYTGAGGNDLLFCLVGNQAIHIRADKSGRKLNTEETLPEKLTTEWHHLVWVAGARDSTVYLDNKPVVKVREEGANIGFHTGFIGHSISDRGRTDFQGLLDEFMMWDRALSSSEVEELWKRGQ